MRAVILLLVALALAGCKDKAHESFSESPTRFRVVRESLYNQVMVERDGDIVDLRFRRGKNVPRQTAVDLSDPERLVIPYSRIMLAAALVQPEPRRVLQLGLGGGAMNRYLRKVRPEVFLQTAEIDATVRDMAMEFMGFRPDAQDVVVIEDARVFVRKNTETWDWILVDAFSGGSVPPHLKTREFYALLKARLAPGGVVAINLHRSNRLFASDQATLRSVFSQVQLFDVPGTGNVVALAFEGPARNLRETDLSRFSGSFREHLGRAVAVYAGPAQTEAAVLTDDYAPTEFLQQQKE
jgi:spermidine synthase